MQARQFAASQPSKGVDVAAGPEFAANQPAKNPVQIACETVDFKPQPNQVDHAIVLRDPAGEQTVLIDTSQGGAIVSLKYQGQEHVWGYNF
jgi:hypothetical protein